MFVLILTKKRNFNFRVCSAACQMPQDEGPMWQAARVHVTCNTKTIQVSLSSPTGHSAPRPVARFDLSFLLHRLFFEEYFAARNSVKFSYALKISKYIK